jgi:para-nitrobenzyl esterase
MVHASTIINDFTPDEARPRDNARDVTGVAGRYASILSYLYHSGYVESDVTAYRAKIVKTKRLSSSSNKMSSSAPISTPCGTITGLELDDVVQYRGITYARAERFEKPVAVTKWDEPFSANRRGPACPQPRMEIGPLITAHDHLGKMERSEHCQSLTMTVPKNTTKDSRLRVMVWIHGGAFVTGSGETPAYDPRMLVSEQNVIVVSLSYRLGLFGFIGDGTVRPANLGLFDLLEGLRWVKRNISSFGGADDARSITLFGESAGASAISDLMLVEGATSLFGRAIIQSAPLGLSRDRSPMNVALNKAADVTSLTCSVEDMLEATAAVRAAGKAWGLPGTMPFAPAYDHSPLPAESQIESIRASVASEIDVLIGCNEHEASLYMGGIPIVSYLSAIPFGIGRMFYNAAVSRYTAMTFHTGTDEFARRYKQAGGNVSLYRIGWCAPNNKMGSTHAIELPLLFGHEDAWSGGKMLEGVDWSDVEVNGRKLRQLWADFAKGRQLEPADSVTGLISISEV